MSSALILPARVTPRELRAELLDPSRGVNVFELTGKKGVTHVANVDSQLGLHAAGHECVTTPAGDLTVHILGVNTFFHKPVLAYILGIST